MSQVYIQDTFTDTKYTILEDHVGELNASWIRPFTANYPNQNLISPANRVFRSAYNIFYGSDCGNGSEHFIDGYTMPVADYIVSAKFIFLGPYSGSGAATDQPAGGGPEPLVLTPLVESVPLVRMSGDIPIGGGVFGSGGVGILDDIGDIGGLGISYYSNRTINETGRDNQSTHPLGTSAEIFARCGLPISDPYAYDWYSLAFFEGDSTYTNGSWKLLRYDGAFRHTIATYAQPTGVTENTSFDVELHVVGTTISGWINGTQVMTVVDANISHAGTVGLRFDGGSSPVRGWHLDDFRVHDFFSSTLTEVLNLEAEVSGQDIILTWDAVATATGYNIYRSLTGCDGLFTYLGASATTTYTDMDLDSGTYTYKVAATSSGDEGPLSNCASGTIFLGSTTEDDVFRAKKPLDEEDAVNGRICAKTKKWYPAHALVNVGGIWYGAENYRPEPELDDFPEMIN